MRLFRPDAFPRDRRDLVFRHGRIGGIVMWVLLAAPFAFVATNWSHLIRGLPWFAWLAVAPIALIVGLVMSVALVSLTQAVLRSFSAENWHARMRSTSIDWNLRSYQNAHFPADAPTIVRIEFSEVASVRRVRERREERGTKRRTVHTLRWLEFELRDVDTTALAAAIAFERDRPAPESKFLGITSRGRFHHVPILVTEEGRVRTLDISAALRKALQRRVPFGEPLNTDLDLAPTRDLDSRLRLLIARGETLAAVSLVRSEMDVSLKDAKDFVDDLRNAA